MFLVNNDKCVMESFTSNFEIPLKFLLGEEDYSLDFLLSLLRLRKDNGLVSFSQENKYQSYTLDINTTILLFIALLKNFENDKELYQDEMSLFIDKFKKHYIDECFLTNLNFVWLLSLVDARSSRFENVCLTCVRRDTLTNKVFHNKGFVIPFVLMCLDDLADGSLKELLTSFLKQDSLGGLSVIDGVFKVEDKDLFYHFKRPVMLRENRYGFDGSALSGSGFERTTPSFC